MAVPAPIREFPAGEPAAIAREVLTGATPCVLRGLIGGWPAVRAARTSAAALMSYLGRFDSGQPADALMTPPQERGRIFYNDTLSGFNFARNRLPLAQLAEQVLRYAAFPQPPAVAAQSAPVSECLPGFSAENPLPLLPPSVVPRIWLGNAITTPTHLDEWHNIGCVVCGRRRFTLFPPEQLVNLYIGPLDFAPTGAPMSLVRLHAPDFGRYPRFRTALQAAVSAELGPGDALYIPPLWWHHVESLEPVNVLVNYWWHALGVAGLAQASGFDALLLALLNVRRLPPAARASWRSLFEHFVFAPEAQVSGHIPAERRGVLGELSEPEAERLRRELAQRLGRSA